MKGASSYIPKTLDEDNIRKYLSDKGMPSDTLSISVLNNGNVLAKEVLVSVKVPGILLQYTSEPKLSENPIWIGLPQINLNKKSDKTQFKIKDFGTTKTAIFEFKYLRKTHDAPEIQILYNGNPCKKVSDLSHMNKRFSTPKVLSLIVASIVVLLFFLLIYVIGLKQFSRKLRTI